MDIRSAVTIGTPDAGEFSNQMPFTSPPSILMEAPVIHFAAGETI